MKIIVAKEKKRKEENKETEFFFHGTRISPERIASFKKKKFVRDASVASWSAGMYPNYPLYIMLVVYRYT